MNKIKNYNMHETGLNNPEVRDALFYNRISIERKIRVQTIAFTVAFVVLVILLVVNHFRIQNFPQALEASSAQVETSEPVSEDQTDSDEVEAEVVGLPELVIDYDALEAEEITNLILENYYAKFAFSFEVIEVENQSGYVSGRTSCSEDGRLYTYDQQGYPRDVERGVWIKVTSCGRGDFDTIYAWMYMPYEAMYRVHTFQDFITAVDNYAVLYKIMQYRLEEALDLPDEQLPPNQLLPEHPFMNNQ